MCEPLEHDYAISITLNIDSLGCLNRIGCHRMSAWQQHHCHHAGFPDFSCGRGRQREFSLLRARRFSLPRTCTTITRCLWLCWFMIAYHRSWWWWRASTRTEWSSRDHFQDLHACGSANLVCPIPLPLRVKRRTFISPGTYWIATQSKPSHPDLRSDDVLCMPVSAPGQWSHRRLRHGGLSELHYTPSSERICAKPVSFCSGAIHHPVGIYQTFGTGEKLCTS